MDAIDTECVVSYTVSSYNYLYLWRWRYPLGLVAGARLTRPAQTSNATSFSGMEIIGHLEAISGMRFFGELFCSPVELALENEQKPGFPEISKFSRKKRNRSQRESDQWIALAK